MRDAGIPGYNHSLRATATRSIEKLCELTSATLNQSDKKPKMEKANTKDVQTTEQTNDEQKENGQQMCPRELCGGICVHN